MVGATAAIVKGDLWSCLGGHCHHTLLLLVVVVLVPRSTRGEWLMKHIACTLLWVLAIRRGHVATAKETAGRGNPLLPVVGSLAVNMMGLCPYHISP
jgi:hypothetical protein